MDEGILYIATGKQYIEEAIQSARQTRAVVDRPIALVADRDVDSDGFDEVIIDEAAKYSYADKPRNMHKSPFEHTLFLDTDIYIAGPIDELFYVLDHFELAAAVAHNETSLRQYDQTWVTGVPKGVPEYNTGVLLYGPGAAKTGFFDRWCSEYSDPDPTDQPSFRKALTETEIQFSALSNVYNCLLGWPMQVSGEVKVYHDISDTADQGNIQRISDRVNATHDPRLLHSGSGRLIHPLSKWGNRTFRAVWLVTLAVRFGRTVREDGLRTAYTETKKFLVRRE